MILSPTAAQIFLTTFSFDPLFSGFCAKYLGCYACPVTREAFEIIDYGSNGYINWEELVFRAKWVIKEHASECDSIETMMKLLFEKYLMPEIVFGIRAKYKRRKSFLLGAEVEV